MKAGANTVMVDLVRDRVVQLHDKVLRDGIATDSADEIFINKLCTLVERKGQSVERSLRAAQLKDAGVTPGTLAWLITSMPIPEAPPGGVPRVELLAYIKALESRLLALAYPPSV